MRNVQFDVETVHTIELIGKERSFARNQANQTEKYSFKKIPRLNVLVHLEHSMTSSQFFLQIRSLTKELLLEHGIKSL